MEDRAVVADHPGMDELETPDPGRRRRAGRRRRSRRGRRRGHRRTQSQQVLTGHGRTVLGQRLLALHRELAESAWRCREIETDQRLASDEELAALQQRVLQLGVEINQLESLLERADDPALDGGESIGPGTVIGVVDAVSGVPSEYRLVACDHDTDSSVVTVGSAAGQAFLGRRVGSLVTLNSPSGQPRRVQVISARPFADPASDQMADETA